jgi:hypothetical protein
MMVKATPTEIAAIPRDATVMTAHGEVIVIFRSAPPAAVRDGLKTRGFRFQAGKWVARPRGVDDVNRAALRGAIATEEADARVMQITNDLAAVGARALAAAGLRVVRLGAAADDGVEFELLA